MRKTAILILITIFAGSCKNSSGEQTSTNKSIRVPGTHVSVAVPDNFLLASDFAGFTFGNDAMINVTDVVGGNYYTNGASFTKEGFEAQGIKVLELKTMTIDNYPAKFAKFVGPDGSNGFALFFGDTTFSVLIMAKLQPGKSKLEEDIKTALLTTKYDKTLKLDPLATAKFAIDDSKSRLKFAKYSAGMYIYSIGGMDKKSYEDNEPMVMAYQIPFTNDMTLQDLFQQFVGNLEKYGMTDKEIVNVSSQKINGYNAYEATMNCKLKGIKKSMYYLFLQENNLAVAFSGGVLADSTKLFDEIKQLGHNVRIKKLQ